MKEKVAVIGLGYVGLPLAISSTNSGLETIGIDLNLAKISLINQKRSPIEDVSDEQISKLIASELFSVSSDYTKIGDADVILICVPTPLTTDRTPELSHLNAATIAIGEQMKKGALVILESTVAPGTTRNFLAPIIMKHSGLAENDFYLAFSPERTDPMNKTWNLENTPKLVSGLNSIARIKAEMFYSKFVKNIIQCDSTEVAETAKLLENSFRLINISFVNELFIFCQKFGIEINDVISAASTKPYGFMPFYPSIGVGGHCIPIDPIYLASSAKSVGAPTRFLDLADQINQEMPGYFVGRAEEKIGGLKDKKVLVIGVSYKPNVADVRDTPIEALILGLENKGAEVFWHDDLVKEWNGAKSVVLSNNYDLAILATPHDFLDLTKLGDVPILYTRGSVQ